MTRRKSPVIPNECWPGFWPSAIPGTALGRDSFIEELKRALTEHALTAEMDPHSDGEVCEAVFLAEHGTLAI